MCRGFTGQRHRIARERLIRRRTGSALSRCEGWGRFLSTDLTCQSVSQSVRRRLCILLSFCTLLETGWGKGGGRLRQSEEAN